MSLPSSWAHEAMQPAGLVCTCPQLDCATIAGLWTGLASWQQGHPSAGAKGKLGNLSPGSPHPGMYLDLSQ